MIVGQGEPQHLAALLASFMDMPSQMYLVITKKIYLLCKMVVSNNSLNNAVLLTLIFSVNLA